MVMVLSMTGLSGSCKFLVVVPIVPHHQERQGPALELDLLCSLLDEPQLLPSSSRQLGAQGQAPLESQPRCQPGCRVWAYWGTLACLLEIGQPAALGSCWPFGAGPQWAGPALPPALMRAPALTQNTLSHQLTSWLRTTFSICI